MVIPTRPNTTTWRMRGKATLNTTSPSRSKRSREPRLRSSPFGSSATNTVVACGWLRRSVRCPVPLVTTWPRKGTPSSNERTLHFCGLSCRPRAAAARCAARTAASPATWSATGMA